MPAARMMPSRELLLMAIAECGSQVVAAKLFGISTDLMQEWCRMLGVKGNNYKRRRGANVEVVERLTDHDKELIKALKGEMSAIEAAAKFDTSRSTVHRLWQ